MAKVKDITGRRFGRLIDVNEAKRRIVEFTKGCHPEVLTVDSIVMLLDKTPTVDAVPVVHGRWIDNTDERGFLCNAWRKCSACGGLNYSKRPPYCPNCGAKMDGGGANE